MSPDGTLSQLRPRRYQGISLKKYPPFEKKPPLEKQGLSFQGGGGFSRSESGEGRKKRKIVRGDPYDVGVA